MGKRNLPLIQKGYGGLRKWQKIKNTRSIRDPQKIYRAYRIIAVFERLYSLSHKKNNPRWEPGSQTFLRFNYTRLIVCDKRRWNDWKKGRIYNDPQTGKQARASEWSSYPKLDLCRFRRQCTIFRRIARALGENDPHFAWGFSSTYVGDAKAVQIEMDIEADHIIDEMDLWRFLDMDCLQFLIERGIIPHFILTGNRSIHIAFYFTTRIDNACLAHFATVFGKGLLHRCGGKLDCDSTHNGMRLPLSIHQKTQELCRYWGTHNHEQIIAYAKAVIPTFADADSLDKVSSEWLKSHTEQKMEVWGNDSTRTDKERRDSRSVVGGRVDNDIALENQPDATERTFKGRCSTRYALEHSQKDYFERLLTNGVPKGKSYELLFKTDFVFWACHRFGSAYEAKRAIAKVIHIGVEGDESTIQERLERLNARINHIRFRSPVPQETVNTNKIQLPQEDVLWLEKLNEELHRDFSRKKAYAIGLLAEYCLKRLSFQGEIKIDITEIMKVLGVSQPTVYDYLKVLTVGKYKIIDTAREYQRGMAKRVYRRVDALPDLRGTTTEIHKRIRPSGN